MTEHRTKRHKNFIRLVGANFDRLVEALVVPKHVSLSAIYNWKRGGSIPSEEIVDRVTEVLGCTRDDIVWWEARKRG